MNRIVKISLYFLTCIASQYSLADFELGMKFYNEEKFDLAHNEFLESATIGDHDAQNNLGVMYFRGEFVAQDKPLAYAWTALASQNDIIQKRGLHEKIFNKLTPEEKALAQLKLKELMEKYSDANIQLNATPIFTGESINNKAQRRIKMVAPEYPTSMLREGRSGYVDLILTIDKKGFTKDQMAYYATSDDFKEAALKASRKWQYEPYLVNGHPVTVTGEKVRLKFNIVGSEVDMKKLEAMTLEMKEKAEKGDSSAKLFYGYFLESIPSYASNYKLPDNPNAIYLQSAKEGNASASFFLGRNILNGNMCDANAAKSMIWLINSAKSGLGDAQYMLAIESFSGARLEKNISKGIYWLNKASDKFDPAKLLLAWILATSTDENLRDGKRAQALISTIKDDYIDKQSLYKVKAATAAENSNFKEAIKWQKEAITDAKIIQTPTPELVEQLKLYTENKPWREEI